jgi:hypothetical protein
MQPFLCFPAGITRMMAAVKLGKPEAVAELLAFSAAYTMCCLLTCVHPFLSVPILVCLFLQESLL